jgi:hypothetical protein
MSQVQYVTTDNTTANGTLSVTWDETLWREANAQGVSVTQNDIFRLEMEIRDLRKVLTELMEILGGKVDKTQT